MKLKITLLSIFSVLVFSGTRAQTGLFVPELAEFDTAMDALMTQYNVPGAQLAITYHGRLVYNRGFGLADVANNTPVQPNNIFRVASVSKTVTSLAIMHLWENNMIDLDAHVFGSGGILDDSTYQNVLDSRVYNITVRNLLEHSGGWDRNISGDPMFNAYAIAQAMSTPPPATAQTIIQYILANKMLDFSPGTQYQYSNFGFCILGRVIEKITGSTYENYVITTLLEPLGITSMACGHNLVADHLPNEVNYYDYPGAPFANSVYDNVTQVEWPNGGFNIDAMDAHGGWVASAGDLCRLLVAFDKFPTKPDILLPATLDTMTAPSMNNPNYAKGIAVNSFNNWWHNGSLSGTTSEIVRANNNELNWALLLNTRTQNATDISDAVDVLVWNVLPSITSWPAGDQFTTGIEETNSDNFVIYPNPASDRISVLMKNSGYARTEVKLVDITGKVVASNVFHTSEITLLTSGIAPGMYILQIAINGGVFNRRVIIE